MKIVIFIASMKWLCVFSNGLPQEMIYHMIHICDLCGLHELCGLVWICLFKFQKWLITSINSDIFGLKMTSCLIEFLIKPVSKVYLSIFFQTLFMKKYFFKTFTNTFNKFLAEFNGWCSDRSSWQQNINGIPVLNILLFWISCV